jgi:hypothetical protein
MNVPNMDATQRIKANKQHQIVAKLIVHKDIECTLTTHQMTPQTREVNIHNLMLLSPFDNIDYLLEKYLFKSISSIPNLKLVEV